MIHSTLVTFTPIFFKTISWLLRNRTNVKIKWFVSICIESESLVVHDNGKSFISHMMDDNSRKLVAHASEHENELHSGLQTILGWWFSCAVNEVLLAATLLTTSPFATAENGDDASIRKLEQNQHMKQFEFHVHSALKIVRGLRSLRNPSTATAKK